MLCFFSLQERRAEEQENFIPKKEEERENGEPRAEPPFNLDAKSTRKIHGGSNINKNREATNRDTGRENLYPPGRAACYGAAK